MSIFLLSNSCIFDSEDSSTQTYLFEVEYINFAWGYQHGGFYIDKTGNVFRYKYGLNDDPWKPASYDHFSGDELAEKYRHSKTLCDKIDHNTLQKQRRLIFSAAEGSYSDSTNVGNDGGGLSYIGYIYESESDSYRPIILELKGDWEYKNESEAAKSMVTWLKTVCQND